MKFFCSDKNPSYQNLSKQFQSIQSNKALIHAVLALNPDEDFEELIKLSEVEIFYSPKEKNLSKEIHVGIRIKDKFLIGALVEIGDSAESSCRCFFVLELADWTTPEESQNKVLEAKPVDTNDFWSFLGDFGTLAYRQCLTAKGRERYVRVHHIPKDLDATVPFGTHFGYSAAIQLFSTEDGRKLIDENPLWINYMTGNTLNAKLPVNALTDAGKSAAYWLCATPDGRALLKNHSRLKQLISIETWNYQLPVMALTDAGKSAAYCLCESDDGLDLIESPEFAFQIHLISPETFNARLPASTEIHAGKSIALLLCSSEKGRALLMRNEHVASMFSAETFNARLPLLAGINAGKSAAFYLFSTKDGQAILEKSPNLIKLISSELLNMPLPYSAEKLAGISIALLLCVPSNGCASLLQNTHLVGLISAETLNAPLPESAGNCAGISLASYLCKIKDGRALISQNRDLIQLIHDPALKQRWSKIANPTRSSAPDSSLFATVRLRSDQSALDDTLQPPAKNQKTQQ